MKPNPKARDSFVHISSLVPVITEEQRKIYNSRNNPWRNAADTWFFKGLSIKSIICKDGLDRKHVINHLATVIQDFSLEHNAKMVSVACLMEEWLEKPPLVPA